MNASWHRRLPGAAGSRTPKVGVLTASISRLAGGLFLSVRALALEIARGGREVDVFSLLDEYAAADGAQWRGVPVHLHEPRRLGGFWYAPSLAQSLRAGGLDVLHTHGLWLYPSVAASVWGRRTGQPRIVSPRGMLDPWALRHCHWKKIFAGMVYENQHLRGASCLHALCEAEARAFRAYGLANPIAIIPNGVELREPIGEKSVPLWAEGLSGGARVLLFLGRIHPKKGLVNLLQAWAAERAGQNKNPWHLVVAGWDQNGHQAVLERSVHALGIGGTVRFVGPQFDADKAASLSRADAFVLPSFSEGLPMAVLEAWAHELPVLMTPQCNLPEGFAASAALGMDPEVGSIRLALNSLFKMTPQERVEMGSRGRRLVEERFTWPRVASEMCSVYDWVLGGGPRPSCVILD